MDTTFEFNSVKTDQLSKYVSEMARNLADAMEELGIKSIPDSGDHKGVTRSHGRTNAGGYDILRFNCDEYQEYDYGSEEDWSGNLRDGCAGDPDREGYYIHGDFHHWTQPVSVDAGIQFLKSKTYYQEYLQSRAELINAEVDSHSS